MSWGLPVRARISLRKKGLPITNEAVEAAILAARADEKPRDCFTDVTEVDVNQAFERGDEVVLLPSHCNTLVSESTIENISRNA